MLFYEYVPGRELIISKQQILTLLGKILILFKLTASSLQQGQDFNLCVLEKYRSCCPQSSSARVSAFSH